MIKKSIEESLCVSCFQVVTNPICPDCLTLHIKSWLEEKGANTALIANVLIGIAIIKKNESLNSDSCIVCNRQSINLCPYCFSLKVLGVLDKLGVPEHLLSEFEQLFLDKFDMQGESQVEF